MNTSKIQNENSPKRTAIIKAANALFETQGFNGTGVDAIASASGVTKRTLYKQFGSKAGLIEAVLEQHHSDMMESIQNDLQFLNLAPRPRLLACFELYRSWFGNTKFSGCIFIKTVNEFGQCSTKLTRIAQSAKQSMRDVMRDIAVEGSIASAEALADELQLLLEGSIIVAQIGHGVKAIDTAQRIAEDRIAQAL